MESDEGEFITWEDAFGRWNAVMRTAGVADPDEEWRLAPSLDERTVTPPPYIQAFLDRFG